MSDLNDLQIFSQVVEHNGFSGAARALGIAPSSVCRRIGKLEEELGIRLVQRTTRRFAVTALGMEFHNYCVKAVTEARAAYEMAARAKATPSGMIRVSCPSLISQLLVSPLIPRFVAKHPQVRIAVMASDGQVDIEENFDLCIRVRQVPSENSVLIMRSLGVVQHVLVASPRLLERSGRPATPAAAIRHPTLSCGSIQGPHAWRLLDPESRQEIQVRHTPVLIADDIGVVRRAAVDGLGIAQLPLSVCVNEIRQGLLEVVLPDYPAPASEIQAIFPSRRGLLPAVRSFIDFLTAQGDSEAVGRQVKPQPSRVRALNENARGNREPLRRLSAIRTATHAEP